LGGITRSEAGYAVKREGDIGASLESGRCRTLEALSITTSYRCYRCISTLCIWNISIPFVSSSSSISAALKPSISSSLLPYVDTASDPLLPDNDDKAGNTLMLSRRSQPAPSQALHRNPIAPLLGVIMAEAELPAKEGECFAVGEPMLCRVNTGASECICASCSWFCLS